MPCEAQSWPPVKPPRQVLVPTTAPRTRHGVCYANSRVLKRSICPRLRRRKALMRLEHCAKALDELQRAHRSATLSAVASGALTDGEAIARADAGPRLGTLGYNAWALG